MPSFQDSIFLFVLALILFGPKRLPVLARELGKWVGEFRRASNEFKMQMEEELRLSEQADRQKQIAAIEAAAPIAPPLEAPEHPHLPASETAYEKSAESSGYTPIDEYADDVEYDDAGYADSTPAAPAAISTEAPAAPAGALSAQPETAATTALPIATSGDLNLMPPSTGLPTPRSASRAGEDPLGGLLDAIPEAPTSSQTNDSPIPETAAHGH